MARCPSDFIASPKRITPLRKHHLFFFQRSPTTHRSIVERVANLSRMDPARSQIFSVEAASVYGRDGQKIGRNERLMLEKTTGAVAYAVVKCGSFLGGLHR